MNEFLKLIFRVLFMFMLGWSIFLIPLLLTGILIDLDIKAILFHGDGVFALILFGIVGVAWGIREGEFIGDIKESHWSNRINDK